MITLIIGGSGSGKSGFAEDYVIALSEDRNKYYIATMQIYDEEGEKKVERHKMLRNGKDFSTIEQPVNIEKAAERMGNGENTALLECISNLVANEMFSGTIPEAEEVVADKIVKGILALHRKVEHLVIVSNNVFEDGNVYDESTTAYICAMGRINQELAKIADEVIEVVVGIPCLVKKQNDVFKKKGKSEVCIL